MQINSLLAINLMKGVVGICLLIQLVSGDVVAQEQPRIIPPSPEAAALGKYADIPVSTYTGVPNISIPLYEIKVRDLSVPISISYHSSGVRVGEEASLVGLGWSLNAGGVITRTVQGKDDLLLTDNLYTGFPETLPSSNCNDDDRVAEECDVTDGQFLTKLCLGWIDPEPDMFYYNFLGRSGKFVLRQKFRAYDAYDFVANTSNLYYDGLTVLEEKIKIIYWKGTDTWEITTADGVIFEFKVREKTEVWYGTAPAAASSADNAIAYAGNNGDSFTSAWYLTKITSPNGTHIDFVYDVDANGATAYGSRSVINHTHSTALTVDGTQPPCEAYQTQPSVWSSSVTYNSQAYLKSILFDGGSVQFHTSDRTDMKTAFGSMTFATSKSVQKLDLIEVKSTSKTIKKLSFTYSYFNNGYQGADSHLYKRLKLTSLLEFNDDVTPTVAKKPHSFNYFEDQPLPSKESLDQDLYGYFNNAGNSNRLVPPGNYKLPATNEMIYVDGANRDSNATYAKQGTLKSIQYPTGGTSEFEYGLHDYSVYGQSGTQYTDLQDGNYFTMDPVTVASYDKKINFFEVTGPTLIDLQRSIFCGQSFDPNAVCYVNGSELVKYASLYLMHADGTETEIASYLLGTDWLQNTNSSNPTNPFVANLAAPRQIEAGLYKLMVGENVGNFSFSCQVKFKSKFQKPGSGAIKPVSNYAGGLRIEKITDFDGIDLKSKHVRMFRYVKDYNGVSISSGRLMMKPENYYVASNHFVGPGDCPAEVYYSLLLGQSASVIPLGSSAQGNAVGYDEVTILEGDSGENGKTVQKFRNDVETHPDGFYFISGFPNNTTFSNSNGQLLEESIYTKDGFLLKKTQNDYDAARTKRVKGIRFIKISQYWIQPNEDFGYGFAGEPGSECDASNIFCQYYDIASQFWYLKSTSVKIYDENDKTNQRCMSSTESFAYETSNIMQLQSDTKINSNGETITTAYEYPFTANGLSQMWRSDLPDYKYMHNYVVGKSVTNNGVPISYQKNVYSFVPSTSQILLSTRQAGISSATLDKSVNYKYDEKGNIVEVSKQNDVPVAYLWSYNQTLPVAEIINATAAEVNAVLTQATLLKGTPTQAEIETIVGSLKSTLPKSRITIYLHDPLNGVVTSIDHNGLRTSYNYDGLQRLISIRDNDNQLLKSFKYNYKN